MEVKREERGRDQRAASRQATMEKTGCGENQREGKVDREMAQKGGKMPKAVRGMATREEREVTVPRETSGELIKEVREMMVQGAMSGEATEEGRDDTARREMGRKA